MRPVAILLTPVLPAPTGAGRELRAWSWLLELARDHDVHVLVPTLTATADAAPIPLPDFPAATLWRCRAGFDVGRKLVKAAGLALPPLALALTSGRFVRDWHYRTAAPFAPGLVAELAGRDVARLVTFRHYLAELGTALGRHFPTARLELDLDDLESQTRASLARAHLELGEPAAAATMLASALQYRLRERQLPGPFAAITLAAEDDRQTLPIATCRPNRIALPAQPPPPAPPGQVRLLFVGTLNYPPNRAAARWLLRELIPALRPRLADWRLTIAGRHAPPALVEDLRRTPQIDFVENAPDLAPLYAAAHVALVPLRHGGGTKYKTIEAFAHRRPVISTAHGVRGLATLAGRDVLIAETATEFAEAIAGLAENPARADQLATAGWSLCRARYSAT